MLGLFYDTETSDMPKWGEPSEHPDQPHLVQLGAELVELENDRILAELNVIVKPEGWTISPENAEIHGITQELAEVVGLPEPHVLNMFLSLWARADIRIAHNDGFDARMIRIGQKRFGHPEDLQERWKAAKSYCTMRESTNVCQLPGKRRGTYKWPKLQEAHRILCGEEFDGAHNAMNDVRACRRVYYALNCGPTATTADGWDGPV